jgi:hypothetical protein
MNLDESMNLVISRLLLNRDFPKYQFERSIDGFLSLFIEEYLSAQCEAEVRYVAAEFPIKKVGNNQSTNVDYVFYRYGSSPAWLFVELKTDKNSANSRQMEGYDAFMKQPPQMSALLRQISEDITPNSRQKVKYKHLLDRIKESGPSTDIDAPIEIFYIIGYSLSAAELTAEESRHPKIKFHKLSQFADKLAGTKHPELWKHVSKLLPSEPR